MIKEGPENRLFLPSTQLHSLGRLYAGLLIVYFQRYKPVFELWSLRVYNHIFDTESSAYQNGVKNQHDPSGIKEDQVFLKSCFKPVLLRLVCDDEYGLFGCL